MSDMAGKAARAAVERSGSCRDTTYFDGPTKCRWQSHSAHDAEPYYSESINTAHDLLTVRDRAVGIPGSVPQSLITDHAAFALRSRRAFTYAMRSESRCRRVIA